MRTASHSLPTSLLALAWRDLHTPSLHLGTIFAIPNGRFHFHLHCAKPAKNGSHNNQTGQSKFNLAPPHRLSTVHVSSIHCQQCCLGWSHPSLHRMQPSDSNSGAGPPSESRTDSNSVAKRQGHQTFTGQHRCVIHHEGRQTESGFAARGNHHSGPVLLQSHQDPPHGNCNGAFLHRVSNADSGTFKALENSGRYPFPKPNMDSGIKDIFRTNEPNPPASKATPS
ncbi:hypothetical protein PCASD_24849 [Puccinia coronata f. sp. avenae]|uniref:Uncharacterized protein n=1 Tax=Puccinia coronata f. sp. avenae TaxID=200324 RepID=A0A2N5S3N5_9BASI|nr:hypothetical protein PCASD_24849 [Puccinia coronata f. sp. avenae]